MMEIIKKAAELRALREGKIRASALQLVQAMNRAVEGCLAKAKESLDQWDGFGQSPGLPVEFVFTSSSGLYAHFDDGEERYLTEARVTVDASALAEAMTAAGWKPLREGEGFGLYLLDGDSVEPE